MVCLVWNVIIIKILATLYVRMSFVFKNFVAILMNKKAKMNVVKEINKKLISYKYIYQFHLFQQRLVKITNLRI